MNLKTLLSRLFGSTLLLATLAVAAETLSEVGLKIGMPYIAGKALLIQNGRKVSEERDPGTRARFPEFPEISCGSGLDAVCSVGFQKERSYLALIVEKRGDQVIIAGEY